MNLTFAMTTIEFNQYSINHKSLPFDDSFVNIARSNKYFEMDLIN